jgi:hypothetical protein
MEITGRHVNDQGYVLLKIVGHHLADRQGYVREHRLVMEEKLGRRLERGEVVHHIDGDTGNNDPANLEVFAGNGHHLKVTRAGKTPNWSEDGKRRIHEAKLGHPVAEETRQRIREKLSIPLDLIEIERRRLNGESLTKIAADIGCSHVTISKRRKKAGYPPLK